jgi:uncharacterized membrane protein
MHKHIFETTGLRRLAYGAVVGVAVALLPWPFDAAARGLLGWCSGVAVFLLLAWWMAERFDAPRTRRRAESLDQPSLLILVSMLVVVMVSVGVIGMLLQQVKTLSGLARGLHIALGLVSLAASWLLIHTIYAFHYAHRFYRARVDAGGAAGSSDPRGLDFPGKLDPDYFDFLYYAFVIGMTSQVSDVQVCSREMRRITLVHGVLSFGFNMVVLALSINVVAGVMQ